MLFNVRHKNTFRMRSLSWKNALLVCGGITTAAAVALLLLCRRPFCKCGVISFWNGDIWSNQNSQQFTDPYTFTHFTHGMALYALVWLARRTWPAPARMVVAVALEAIWEIIENTTFAIERYREATIS